MFSSLHQRFKTKKTREGATSHKEVWIFLVGTGVPDGSLRYIYTAEGKEQGAVAFKRQPLFLCLFFRRNLARPTGQSPYPFVGRGFTHAAF